MLIEPTQAQVEAVFAEPKFLESTEDRYMLAREVVVLRAVIALGVQAFAAADRGGKKGEAEAAQLLEQFAADAGEALPENG